jgi:hypothetical protein
MHDLDNFSRDLRKINGLVGLERGDLDHLYTFGCDLAMKGESIDYLKISAEKSYLCPPEPQMFRTRFQCQGFVRTCKAGIDTTVWRLTMAIVKCESCSGILRIGDKYAGRRGKCPVCRTPFVVPLRGESLNSGPSAESVGVDTAMNAGAPLAVPAPSGSELSDGPEASRKAAHSMSLSRPNLRFVRQVKTAVLFGVILTVFGIGLTLGVSVKTTPHHPDAGLLAKASENPLRMQAEQPVPIGQVNTKPASSPGPQLNAEVRGKVSEEPPLRPCAGISYDPDNIGGAVRGQKPRNRWVFGGNQVCGDFRFSPHNPEMA